MGNDDSGLPRLFQFNSFLWRALYSGVPVGPKGRFVQDFVPSGNYDGNIGVLFVKRVGQRFRLDVVNIFRYTAQLFTTAEIRDAAFSVET